MSSQWSPAEERAMASDPSEWVPVDVDVDPNAGMVFRVRFDRGECGELFEAVGDDNPFEFIKAAALERAREMIAEREAADSVTAAD